MPQFSPSSPGPSPSSPDPSRASRVPAAPGSGASAGSSGPPGRARIRPPVPPARAGTARQALGRYGESLAVRRLTEAGLVVLARNWRCRAGEIDILARDGDALVVCEVKTRRAGPFEHPLAAVTPRKTQRLRALAECWLERQDTPPPGGVRIDVVAVVLPARGAPTVEHVRGVA